MKENKDLNKCFSSYEKDELKARLKQIKNPQNRHVADMINYDNDTTTDMSACVVFNT